MVLQKGPRFYSSEERADPADLMKIALLQEYKAAKWGVVTSGHKWLGRFFSFLANPLFLDVFGYPLFLGPKPYQTGSKSKIPLVGDGTKHWSVQPGGTLDL